VDHWSLPLDFKILWRTVLKVIRGEGISARDHATMPFFTGSKAEVTEPMQPEEEP
jgi:hypothetical protein